MNRNNISKQFFRFYQECVFDFLKYNWIFMIIFKILELVHFNLLTNQLILFPKINLFLFSCNW